ncbi:MAG: hypothetical protein ACI4V7_02225 [Succinivibrionaceae bacterium]
MNVKKIIALFASMFFFSNAYSLSDDYGLRANNDQNMSFDVKTTSNYKYFYSIMMVSKAPNGYSNLNNFKNIYFVLDKANNEGQLTKEGKELYKVVSTLNSNIKKFPSLKLTPYGEKMISAIGESYAKSRASFMLSKKDYDDCVNIKFIFNGDDVSLQTGESLILGMTKSLPPTANIIYEQELNDGLLSFYDTNEYKRYLNSYPELDKSLGTLDVLKQYKTYIESVLPRIFKEKFVKELTHIGVLTNKKLLSKVDDKVFVKDLFELYQFIPSIEPQIASTYKSLFDLLVRPSERKFFSSVDDARLFYKYGAGLKSLQISKTFSALIYKDFFDVISFEKEDLFDNTAFKAYFVDPKTLLSFMSFLRGEQLGTPLSVNEGYDLNANVYNVSQIAPQGSVLLADIYKNQENNYAVKFSLNGKDIMLTSNCNNSKIDSNYYDISKLNDCLLTDGK